MSAAEPEADQQTNLTETSMKRISLAARAGLIGTLAALIFGAVPGAAAEPEFPARKPITLVVPFAPGGGNDIVARLIAPKMSQLLGQTIVIENKPGAGGNLGTDAVARAPRRWLHPGRGVEPGDHESLPGDEGSLPDRA
jgi:hypothetical protein